jgi:hypothetical protein
MADAESKQDEFDLFISHATSDKPWVQQFTEQLEARGLRVFLDSQQIAPRDNFVLRLSDGLEKSRYLALVLSNQTDGRPWIAQEWTSFMAEHGPMGRLLPVLLDAVALPSILKATQAIDATHRDASRVADDLFKLVGDPSTLQSDDGRRLVIGRDIVFTLSRDAEQLSIVRPDGSTRSVSFPWEANEGFAIAYLEFEKLHREAIVEVADRADLFRHARVLGSALFETLFDSEDAKRMEQLWAPDRARPVIQIRSDDDILLSLPWELLHHENEFLVREGRIDLVRTTPTDAAGETLLRKPTTPFKLVVNVSAPESSGPGLRYEEESYRITLATADRCAMVPTELGTLDDLIETVDGVHPTGIHFSGHGTPGALMFEDDEGREHVVKVGDVIRRVRDRLPDDRRLPPFFYLASCHGNDPAVLNDEQPGAPSAAVQLHKAGVTEVVGYFGPIVDKLSTLAEETVYEAIAEGRATRDAVRLARMRLAQPFHERDARLRPATPQPKGTGKPFARQSNGELTMDTHPFAWAQLVLYRRGPEWPLSIPLPTGKRRTARVLERRFESFGDRKVLKTGFIGRRLEQHKIRRRIRQGDRVIVLQGLGGLGKSTLAQQVLPWLTDDRTNICTLWCQEVEGNKTTGMGSRAEALVGQLLEYCRRRFGLSWESIVQQVDQLAGDDSARRFLFFSKLSSRTRLDWFSISITWNPCLLGPLMM